MDRVPSVQFRLPLSGVLPENANKCPVAAASLVRRIGVARHPPKVRIEFELASLRLRYGTVSDPTATPQSVFLRCKHPLLGEKECTVQHSGGSVRAVEYPLADPSSNRAHFDDFGICPRTP